jgi:hypothetical protein
LQQLQEHRASWPERLEHHATARPPLFLAGRMLARYLRYRRWRRNPAHAGQRLGFLRYCQYEWDAGSLRELPAQIVLRGARRLWQDLAQRRRRRLTS